MKLIICAFSVLSLILVSVAAMAMPAVGDYAKYDLSITPAGGTAIAGVLEKEIIAFNSNTSQYNQRTTISAAGTTPNVSEAWVNASDLITDAGIVQIQSNCASFGGTLGTSTTPAGQFPACSIPVESNTEHSTYAIGAVPFGLLAADILSKSDGSHTIATINAFRIGQ